MSKFLHIQQFNGALTYPDLQPMLRKLGYTMLGNGQSFQQFGQNAKMKDKAKESWLLDIYPEKDFFHIDNLAEIDAEFSGVYFHKMKFSVDLFRDVFGVKSLYYYFKEDLLIASNELRAILACLPEMPAINDSQIAAYFNPETNNNFIQDQTFFDSIKRVLPGQKLHFRAGKIKSSFYWQPDFNTTLAPEELIPAFTKRLTAATLSKVNGKTKIAANLSGGLDSSSLCALISLQTNSTLKGLFFDTESSASFEKKYAREVAHSGQFELSEVSQNEELYESIKKITRLTCKPESMIIPSAIFLPIMNEATLHGSSVLISGHGGDSTVGYGHEYIKELISKGKFKKVRAVLMKKWLLLEEDDADPFESYLIKQVFTHTSASKAKLALRMLLSRSFKNKILFEKIKGSFLRKSEPTIQPILHVFPYEIAKETGLKDWYQAIPSQHHYGYVKNSLVDLGCQAMETLDAIGRQYNLVSSYPFLDKELLYLAANVPSAINFQNGYLRGTLRDAMKDILPENVRLRTKKAAFNDFAFISFKKLETQCGHLFHEKHLLWKYVNNTAYQLHLHNIHNDSIALSQKGQDLWLCSKVLYLGIWLNEFYTS